MFAEKVKLAFTKSQLSRQVNQLSQEFKLDKRRVGIPGVESLNYKTNQLSENLAGTMLLYWELIQRILNQNLNQLYYRQTGSELLLNQNVRISSRYELEAFITLLIEQLEAGGHMNGHRKNRLLRVLRDQKLDQEKINFKLPINHDLTLLGSIQKEYFPSKGSTWLVNFGAKHSIPQLSLENLLNADQNLYREARKLLALLTPESILETLRKRDPLVQSQRVLVQTMNARLIPYLRRLLIDYKLPITHSSESRLLFTTPDKAYSISITLDAKLNNDSSPTAQVTVNQSKDFFYDRQRAMADEGMKFIRHLATRLYQATSETPFCPTGTVLTSDDLESFPLLSEAAANRLRIYLLKEMGVVKAWSTIRNNDTILSTLNGSTVDIATEDWVFRIVAKHQPDTQAVVPIVLGIWRNA